jgi:hypothetical protein
MEPLNSLFQHYRKNRKAIHTVLGKLGKQGIKGASNLNTRLLAAEGYGDAEKYLRAESLEAFTEKLREDAFGLLIALNAADIPVEHQHLFADMRNAPVFSSREDHLSFIEYFLEQRLEQWMRQGRRESAFETGGPVEPSCAIRIRDCGDSVKISMTLTVLFGKKVQRKQEGTLSLNSESMSQLLISLETFCTPVQAWLNVEAPSVTQFVASLTPELRSQLKVLLTYDRDRLQHAL